MGVEGDFGFKYDPKFLSLAHYYLKEYALSDPGIAEHYEFTIKAFPAHKYDEDIIEEIFLSAPAMIAFSAYLPEIEKTKSLCRKIKCVLPDTPIIIGGPSIGDSVSFLSENTCIDIVVRLEGEETFRELLTAFIADKNLSNINGITFRSNNEIIKNPDRPLSFDVNAIPLIFTDEFMEGTSGIATCETTRGCRNHCRFCGIGRSLLRSYNIDRIEHDLKQILSNKNIRRIFIGDSDFFTDRERTEKLLEILIKYNRHKTQIEFYSDFLGVDEELLKECKKAYIHDSLRIPLQTLTEKALQESNREWFDFDRVRRSAQAIIKYFPSTNAELIYGLPGDDYEGIKRSLRWCAEIGLINPKLHRLQNLPGSVYTRNSNKYGLVADVKSPHYVYKSDTFSYEDTLRVEALSRNLQAIYSFLFPFDYNFLISIGIDIFDIAENIHIQCPEWNLSFTRASEANVSETNPSAARFILEYLSRHNSISTETHGFLNDLFEYRYAAKNLYIFFREAVLYNADIDTEPLPGQGAFIPRHTSLEVSHDIKDTLDPQARDQYMARKRQKLYFLYSHKQPGVVPVRIRNTDMFEETIRHFDGSCNSCASVAESVAAKSEFSSDIVLPLTERLFQRGFVFFARPEHITNNSPDNRFQ